MCIKRCKREGQGNFVSSSWLDMEAKDLNAQVDGKADTSVGSDLHRGIYWQNCLCNDTARDTAPLWICLFHNNRSKPVTTSRSKSVCQVVEWYMPGVVPLFGVKSSLVSLYVCKTQQRR